MRTFSITIDDDIYDFITKESLIGNISKSEDVRRRLVDSYHSTQKQEEKVVKRFEEFEKSVNQALKLMEDRVLNMGTKNIMYSMTNFHFLKMLSIHGLNKTVGEVKNLVSLSKSETLFNPTDSINSKKRFEENISEEHLKSRE